MALEQTGEPPLLEIGKVASLHSVPVHHGGFQSGGLGPIAARSPQAGPSILNIAQWIWTQTRLQCAIWKRRRLHFDQVRPSLAL